MKNKFLTKSENMTQEYCATVVRLGEIQEIKGANTVAKTLVNGRTIVIGKDHKEGDVMIYCSNESQLNFDFLSVNNLFQHIDRNCNAEEVNKYLAEHDLTEDEEKEYLRTHRGYFDDKGRVRMKKLAGEISMGVLFEFESLKKWCPVLSEVNIEELVGLDFDTVNDVLFVKAYVPEIKTNDPSNSSHGSKRDKKLLKFNRMIPGQFAFHYDTQLFEKVVKRFKPDDVVAISNKLHGTSYVIGNVLTKKPKWKGIYEKMFLYLPKFLQFTVEDYDVIYSSRSVIKNPTINANKKGFSKGLDRCFDKYYELLKDYIPQGVTLYGEIVGYEEGSNSFIQTVGQGYDYRCKPGENQFMIYRVKQVDKDGNTTELNIVDVQKFSDELKQALIRDGKDDVAARIRPLEIFYYGKLGDLYPDLSVTEHWHENLLERMKNDKEHFGMEGLEPGCRNSVPREGIVIRIENDVIPEAFKLKCLKFLGKEAKEMDKGKTNDAEMMERYEN